MKEMHSSLFAFQYTHLKETSHGFLITLIRAVMFECANEFSLKTKKSK